MIRQLHFLVVGSLFLLMACSTSTKRSSITLLRSQVRQGQYQQAMKLVKSKKYYPEKNSTLLKMLEEGMLLHLTGDYHRSTKVLDRARELSDQLYTVSISKKIAATIASNQLDKFYGEKYESSMIRFFLALNHYLIYQQGQGADGKKLTNQQLQNHLAAARANITEWDSLLNNYRQQVAGETSYKDDLSAKLFGAFVHQQIGSSAERQIAIQLYRDAKKILFRNYNSYRSFNGKAASFRKNFKKLPGMKKSVVKKKFVTSSRHAKQLINYINHQLKILTGKIKKRDNIQVVLEQGLISAKSVKKINFPLPTPAVPLVTSGGRGLSLIAFTLNVLSISKGLKPSITFELPTVVEKRAAQQLTLIVQDKKGQVIKRTPLALMNPLSDLAHEALSNRVTATYTKIGARVAAKHAAAIATAYISYKKSIRSGIPHPMAQIAAGLIYAGLNKGIAASEKADLRCWSTLPHSLRIGSLRLPKGNYNLVLERKQGKSVSNIPLQGLLVDSSKKVKLLRLRVN